MKRSSFLLVLAAVMVAITFSSCLSMLKADRLIYAGSVGKKIDAVMIDSLSKVDLNTNK